MSFSSEPNSGIPCLHGRNCRCRRNPSKQSLQVTAFEQVELEQTQYLLHAKSDFAHELYIGKQKIYAHRHPDLRQYSVARFLERGFATGIKHIKQQSPGIRFFVVYRITSQQGHQISFFKQIEL